MKSSARFDVVGIGNAIVDVIARTDDDFLIAKGLHKGGMTLIDAETSSRLYDAMGPATVSSGGSAANTMVGVASLGGKAAFLGKVRDDESGRAIRHDIRAAGVDFSTAAALAGTPTARCLVMVTPDGERTMSTYLGACVEFGPDDVDETIIGQAGIVYLEGYLWDPPQAKAAFRKAADLAHRNGAKIALTLSDAFCVDRYRDEFLDLMRKRLVDIVFANESELHALYQTADFQTAVSELEKENVMSFITRSGAGCMVVDKGASESVPATPIERVVDTTGAGDLFAAGVLFGLARNMQPARCAVIGGIAAAEVIQHYGARPERPLSQLIGQAGL